MSAMIRALCGPRVIDPYIRLATLIVGLFIGAPSSFELLTDLNAQLDIAFGILIIALPYFPRTIALIITAVSITLTVGLTANAVINDLALSVAGAVLLTYKRWKLTSLPFASLVALNAYLLIGSEYYSFFHCAISIGTFVLASTLGWAAGTTEQRITRLIADAATQAAESERREADLRNQFALDAHDTVSHGLTKEYFMLRNALSKTEPGSELNQGITEILLANRTNQQNLRSLLAGLHSTTTNTVALSHAVEAVCDDIREAFSAAQRPIRITCAVTDQPCPPQRTAGVGLLLTELATNILKHGDINDQSATLDVTCDGRGLLITAQNTPRQLTPRPEKYTPPTTTAFSVERRVTMLNGTADFHTTPESFTVTATVPLNAPEQNPTTSNASAAVSDTSHTRESTARPAQSA